MKNLDRAKEWLQRAKSNMARAKAGRVSPDILYEDLCYDKHWVLLADKAVFLDTSQGGFILKVNPVTGAGL